MEAFKRFMVIAFSDYYPSGGLSDCYTSHDTLEEAKKHNPGLSDSNYVFDRIEGKIVYDFNEPENVD